MESFVALVATTMNAGTPLLLAELEIEHFGPCGTCHKEWHGTFFVFDSIRASH